VVITAVEPMVGERQSYHCLGDKKDYIRAHKVLPIKGDAADADIDADFRTFSKALHNCTVTNKTANEELMKVANAAITNGSKLSCTGFEVNKATYENEGCNSARPSFDKSGRMGSS
jgi:hypothetical protein